MNEADLREYAMRAAHFAADYRAGLRDLPVRPNQPPGAVAAQLPTAAPEAAEPMADILADFERVIVPGMTHWQHPRFFAYFPANAAPASVVAEMLVAAMGAQCMLWQTSPAATELEIVVLRWLAGALGLPAGFQGVIQDSASSSTLCAVLTMRELATNFGGNRDGLSAHPPLRVYSSAEVHSSVDKAIRLAGLGEANHVKIPIVPGPLRAMDTAALAAAIARDRAAGLVPAGIVAAVGGTSTGATDDISAVADVAARENLYLHVDAAWAGSAMICPEFRHLWAGIERADSIVLNPHKWLGAQFDCSVQYLKDPKAQVQTLAIQPEYLKTLGRESVINFSEWTTPLGRRFRALKLWFLLRAHGLEGLRTVIRNHIAWSHGLARRLAAEPDFTLVTAPVLSLFSFRHQPAGLATDALDAHTLKLVEAINADGRIYLTQTRVDGRAAIRFQAGAFGMQAEDADVAFQVICEVARVVARTLPATGRS